jgi:hypothetical protein
MKLWVLFCCAFISGCFYTTENRAVLLKQKGIQNIKIGDVELTTRVLNIEKIESGNVSSSRIIYFNVRIERTNENKFEKEKMLYADFDMQKDFVLAVAGDSIASTFCQKIENGRRNNYEYAIAFEIPKQIIADDLTLVYNDKIFGVGTVAFPYSQNDLKNFEPKS